MNTNAPPWYQQHRPLQGPRNVPPLSWEPATMLSWLQQQSFSYIYGHQVIESNINSTLYNQNTYKSSSVTKLVHDIQLVSNKIGQYMHDIRAKGKF